MNSYMKQLRNWRKVYIVIEKVNSYRIREKNITPHEMPSSSSNIIADSNA